MATQGTLYTLLVQQAPRSLLFLPTATALQTGVGDSFATIIVLQLYFIQTKMFLRLFVKVVESNSCAKVIAEVGGRLLNRSL